MIRIKKRTFCEQKKKEKSIKTEKENPQKFEKIPKRTLNPKPTYLYTYIPLTSNHHIHSSQLAEEEEEKLLLARLRYSSRP